MNKKFAAVCLAVATLSLAACTAAQAGQPAPQHPAKATFTNLVSLSNGYAVILELGCNNPDKSVMYLTLPVDNATEGDVFMKVTTGGTVLASKPASLRLVNGKGVVDTPPFSREAAHAGVRVFIEGAPGSRDDRFADITGAECSSKAVTGK